MGKAIHSLMVISIVLTGPLCYSQTLLQISEPRLEMKDHMIHIYYDIQNSDPSEKYMISIDIRDEKGNPVDANALEGDIGLVDNGGMNKQIVWNLEADSVFINAYVFVKINARVVPPPVKETIEPREEIAQKMEDNQEIEESKPEAPPEVNGHASFSTSSAFSRKAIALQSLALPGLGLTRVTEKPHWIRGIAGYGCIAGSVVLNRRAIHTFATIDDIEDSAEAEDAFHKSVRQDKFSEGMAFAAIGIWITDIVWTWVGTSDLGSATSKSDRKQFDIGTDIDPLSHAPLVCLRYTFKPLK